jgi:UDP-N-acetylglucosamine--N-acetylmuramyl-(pentapeptide) pyrophosphoryl-undecaprenol N-acetylglucosamine transferase
MQAHNPVKVIISGGGTGGHIFPAIAIANALKAINANIDILFVGAKGRMEMEKVPAAGYKIDSLWISGLQRRLTLDNLTFVFKVMASVYKSHRIINRFKPDVVVGVGGYASGPLLYAASQRRIPSLIQEQNSYPGITNKLLARKVNRICVAYSGMEKYFPKDKLLLTGNPVRQDIMSLEGKRPRAAEFFKLDATKKTVLVIGGSLGARTINQSIQQLIKDFDQKDIQLIWQTGKAYYNQAVESLAGLKQSGIRVFDFISKMDYAYAIADVVISRSGASSVSELSLVNKPAILIPSPNVAEDHQTKNAMALVTHNAALLIKDSEAHTSLGPIVFDLVENDAKRMKLQENIASLAFSNSADVIANEVLNLVYHKKK